MGTVKGVDAIWQVLGPLHEKAVSVEYFMHNIAETTDGIVLTDRTDRYELEDRVVEFPVMGVFQLEGEIIRQWRDYFDLQQCLEQLPEDPELPNNL